MFYDDYDMEDADKGPCEFGCDDEDGHNHVTMNASDWVLSLPEGTVIGEFQG
jgi:hypothetical protein